MKKLFSIALVLVMLLSCAALAEEPITLTYAEVNPLEGTIVGAVATAFKEEVEELQHELEQLQSDYEALRKNRDMWVTKYNQLNAEFEEYKRTHPDPEGGEAWGFSLFPITSPPSSFR